jgi:hypothetical protein
LVSSVIRGSNLGESHGGLYLVDLENRTAELKLDWNRPNIDFSGRGGDRGLRGIAFHGERILIAANSTLLVFDRDFCLLESFTNPYLKHCHEISVSDRRVFLTATGFDSLLVFDLGTKRFTEGWCLAARGAELHLLRYDPASGVGPAEQHRFHLNSVAASPTGMWFSGLYTPGLMFSDGRRLDLVSPLPPGTHNAQAVNGGVLYNDTASERVCYRRGGQLVAVPVPECEPAQLVQFGKYASEVARPRFARGLCVLRSGLVAGGSSPSTVSLYDLSRGSRILQVTLSRDVRNAVHGLAEWPFA